MTDSTSYAPEVQQALNVAKTLVQLGVPIFLLEPDPTAKTGYKTPKGWQNTTPDPSVVDRWQPGMAVAAVTGLVFDVIDVDPRNGGTIDALDGAMPTVYAKAATPSGGSHFWIKPLGLPKGEIGPGLDYQGGSFTPNTSGSHSRGFVFLPPTARVSKVDGAIYAYAWNQMPPVAMTQEYVADESGHQLALNLRSKKQKEASDAKSSYTTEVDEFLLNGIPMGRQHYILSRIAYDMVARKQGDLHIMATMKMILTRSHQDMADPWTDEALMSLIYSARGKLDKNAIFDTWMIEETINLISRQREADGGDPALPKATEHATRQERARREARKRADAEEAAATWTGLGASDKLSKSLQDLPESVDWLIPGLLGSMHNFLLIGKFKSGKTTLLASMLRSLLDGHSFLNHFSVNDTAADKRVGIWNGEMDADEFIGYMKNAGIQNGHMAEVMHLRGKSVPFMSNPVAREDTINWLASNNIKIWIIDSMTRLSAWNKVDKKDGSIDQLCNELDLIKAEAGVECVVLLTHTPKNEEEGKETAYGAQELQAWADSWWILTTDKGKRFLSAEGRKVFLEETHLEFDESTGLMTLGEGSRIDHRKEEKEKELDHKEEASKMGIRQRILEYVEESPGCNTSDIRTGVVGKTTLVGTTLAELITDGRVIPVKGKHNTTHHYIPGAEPVSS